MMIWHLAICQDCTPILPQPFTDPRERAEWMFAHTQATGHAVLCTQEERAS